MKKHIGHCAYCGRTLAKPTAKSNARLTRDHVTPKALGGRVKVRACWTCNQLKADLTPGEWDRARQLFPDWWRRFRTHHELMQAMKQGGTP